MFKVRYLKHNLLFKFPAGTSRGVMHEKTSWYLVLEAEGKTGIGEAGPLPGLSPDDRPDFEERLAEVCIKINELPLPTLESELAGMARGLAGEEFPSIQFALETALLDWFNGGRRILYQNPFSVGQQEIPINGLIWMGDKNLMRERIKEKLEAGFNCLKMKIGAIHFEEECSIISEVRKHFSAEDIILRVDANGAFSPDEAMQKLEILAKYNIHSIEQPIKPGQAEEMFRLCRQTPIPIALDEELIGVPVGGRGKDLLTDILPHYIILKPGLIGGMEVSRQWIELAEQQRIGWWITSALESNIGLNAISQFTANFTPTMPQGLGTGQLYHNNIPSPLRIKQGKLRYDQNENWKLELMNL